MNTKLLIGIVFAIMLFAIMFFLEPIMNMIQTENFDVLNPNKDTLNFEF